MIAISIEMQEKIKNILHNIVLERVELYPSTVNVMAGTTDLRSYVEDDLQSIYNDERQHIIDCFNTPENAISYNKLYPKESQVYTQWISSQNNFEKGSFVYNETNETLRGVLKSYVQKYVVHKYLWGFYSNLKMKRTRDYYAEIGSPSPSPSSPLNGGFKQYNKTTF